MRLYKRFIRITEAFDLLDNIAMMHYMGLYDSTHSSIVRSLLAGTPTRVTAAQHDTSTGILEKVYSAFILDYADVQARRGILDTGAPATANVVPLARVKGDSRQ